jgi:hypothetical protein
MKTNDNKVLPLLIRSIVYKNSRISVLNSRSRTHPLEHVFCTSTLQKTRNMSNVYKAVHIDPPKQQFLFTKNFNVEGKSLLFTPNLRKSKFGKTFSREFIKSFYNTNQLNKKHKFSLDRYAPCKTTTHQARIKYRLPDKLMTSKSLSITHKNYSVEIKSKAVNALRVL